MHDDDMDAVWAEEAAEEAADRARKAELPPESIATNFWPRDPRRVNVDGVIVRFTEDGWSVKALVEGRLSDIRLEQLQSKTLATLQQLDATDWEIESN